MGYTYYDLELEDNSTTKDEKKGVKDAKKALKKIEYLTRDSIQDLIDNILNRTANPEYINGYLDICRQAIGACTMVA